MTSYVYDATDKRSVNSLMGRVYGYMFFGILITAIIAFGVGILFNVWIFGQISISEDLGNVEKINSTGLITLLVVLGISAIGVLIMSFVVQGTYFRGKKSVMVPALIYSILMGLLLSSLVIFVPWPVLGITFLITAGIFGIMFLISYLSKGSLNFLGVIGIGLLIGAALIGLVGWIFILTGFLGAYMHLYWIVSFISFVAIMFITIWDMWRIKKIAEAGEMNDNLALFCAFTLYVDFIYLFLRVLRFVAYLFARRR